MATLLQPPHGADGAEILSRPPRFRMRKNLEVEMRALNLNASKLAQYSELPIPLVQSVIQTRHVSKRVLARLRRGITIASEGENRPVDHLTLGYLAEKAP